MDLVSIIIPTFNRAKVLQKTLQSVRDQKHQNWECLVVDDGSADATAQLVQTLSKVDSRFQYLQRPHNRPKGANACRNFGLENAQGSFVVFFDSDDLMLPKFLETQIACLKDGSANYSICNSKWVLDNEKEVDGFHGRLRPSDDRLNHYIRFVVFWPINAVCYKHSFLKEHGLMFNEALWQSQDYDFHIRVLQVDPEYVMVPDSLVHVIASENSISFSHKHAYKKAKSSLWVKSQLLRDKRVSLDPKTKVFLLHDMHRVFKQNTLAKNRRTSFHSGYRYLKAHGYAWSQFGSYFWKHVVPVVLVLFTYNFFGKGYSFLKKSNTFNYTKET